MRSSRLSAAAVLSVLVLAAGCGGGDDEADGGGDGFADQAAKDIAAAAKADMKKLESVHYAGGITTQGSTIELDIQATSAGDCSGSVSIGEGTAEVLSKDGESWFRPDEAFWRAQAPDQADAILAAVGEKWVVDNDAQFAQFCDLDEFFDNIFASGDKADGEYTKVGTDELDGQDVVKVENKTDEGSAVGYVLVESPHYLLKVERTTGDEPGKIEFSDFDEELDLAAPAADEVVDLSGQ